MALSSPTTPTPTPAPPTTPAPATTSKPASSPRKATPAPAYAKLNSSSLSPEAEPFYPSTEGRNKFQRWKESPSTASPLKFSYRDALCGGLAPRKVQPSPDPPQPAHIRLRSEIHRVKDAAPEEEGWREVRSRRSRRREVRGRQIYPDPRDQRSRHIPVEMIGRCFNCLEKGHRRAQCREPTRCLRCGRAGHRSFECARPCRDNAGSSRQSNPKTAPAAPPREKLRRAAGREGEDGGQGDPSAQHRSRRRRRGRRGTGHRRRQRGQGDDGNSGPHRERQSSPSPSPAPRQNEMHHPKVCYVDRSPDMEQWEAELEYLAVLVQIVGTRPTVEPQAARRAIAQHFDIEEFAMEIYKVAPPEDFLLKLPNHGALQRVLQGDRTVTTPAFKLALKPWTRLVNAEHGALYHKVQIDLQGIPLHAWEQTVAADLLRPFCSVESVDPDTRDRRNIEFFRVTARTTRPELIPPFRILAIPEPTDGEGPFRPVKNTLNYVIQITVRRLLIRLPPDSPPCSPPPTPPSDTSSDNDDEDSPPTNPKRRRPTSRRQRQPREDTPPTTATGAAVEIAGARAHGELRQASGHEMNNIHGGGTQSPTTSGPIINSYTAGTTLPEPTVSSNVQTGWGPQASIETAECALESLRSFNGAHSMEQWVDPMIQEASASIMATVPVQATPSTETPREVNSAVPAHKGRVEGEAEAPTEAIASNLAQPGVEQTTLWPLPRECDGPNLERPGIETIEQPLRSPEQGTSPGRNSPMPAERNHVATPETQTTQVRQTQPEEEFFHDITKAIPDVRTPAATCSRKRRKVAPPTTMRRSRRIAESATGGHALHRAQIVLMRKLGLISEQEKMTDEAKKAYVMLFDHPLTPSHIAALTALIGWPDESGQGQSCESY